MRNRGTMSEHHRPQTQKKQKAAQVQFATPSPNKDVGIEFDASDSEAMQW